MTTDIIKLDPGIRLWVLLPITLCTLLMGLLRHYLSIILKRPPQMTLFHRRDQEVLWRYGAVRRWGHLVPLEQYVSRRHFYTDDEVGLFAQRREKGSITSALTSPATMSAQVYSLLTSVVPQMLVGAWARYFFSGFAVARLPFHLAEKYRPMLQSGIEMTGRHLDVSYVSALSWYVLNLFGQQALLGLIVGSSVDIYVTGFPGAGGALNRGDPGLSTTEMMNIGSIFAKEKEAMTYAKHTWRLPSVEKRILEESPPDGTLV